MSTVYAGYPAAPLYEGPGRDRKQIHQLLWGDWIRVTGPAHGAFLPVRVRGEDGFVHRDDVQDERLLEIVFVDVGQGDGCLLVTPDDRHVVVDAGLGDNMYRFLKWRYGGFRRDWTFEAAVLTHPDADHYAGFGPLFDDPHVHFDTVYLNGVLEDRSASGLGPHRKASNGFRYLTELLEDDAAVDAWLDDTARWKHPSSSRWDKQYASLLEAARTSGRVGAFRMLSTDHHDGTGHVPGFGADDAVSLRVLGPAPEVVDGIQGLRAFSDEPHHTSLDKGKTKNGHSVVLRLEYRDVSILLGGDLNRSAEAHLLQHHAGFTAPWPWSPETQAQIRLAAGPAFQVDVAKSCHHGSADFSDLFLETCHAAATVVSSGDEESHAHPRCDTLGALGASGFGWRPLIFSTELARSHREDEGNARQQLDAAWEALADATTDTQRQRATDRIRDLQTTLTKRNVTVYGAINLRTDGKKVVMAYMRERLANYGGELRKWDIYRLERPGNGRLSYVAG